MDEGWMASPLNPDLLIWAPGEVPPRRRRNRRKLRRNPPAGRCHYCRGQFGSAVSAVVRGTLSSVLLVPSWDHIVPLALGGPYGAGWNLVGACRVCNEAKADRLSDCDCPRCVKAMGTWRSAASSAQRARLGEWPRVSVADIAGWRL
jgi:hypothetical protein